MDKSFSFSAAALAVSMIAIGILVLVYLDSQARLMSIAEQLDVANSKLIEQESSMAYLVDELNSTNFRLNELESYVSNIGIVAYWKLDENTGSTVNDDSRNGNPASVENNPSWRATSQCVVGTCLEFDGVDDYLRGPEESMRIDSYWTVSGWIKLSSHDSFNIMVTKMGSSNGHVNYEMKIDQQGHLVCRNHNDAGENFQSASTESLLVDA